MMDIEGNAVHTEQDVQAMLQKIRRDPRTSSPRVLGINMLRQAVAKGNGYPKDLYHATLPPERAMKEEEEVALKSLGYQDQYIRREFPKMLLRRNFGKHFAPKDDPATGEQRTDVVPYLEHKECKGADQEKKLLAARADKDCSVWVTSMDALPPLPEESAEDPAVTIARLEGELAAARRGEDKRKAG